MSSEDVGGKFEILSLSVISNLKKKMNNKN